MSLSGFVTRWLSTGRALDTAKFHTRPHMLQIFKVIEQILEPETGSFTDRGHLSRL